MDMVNLESYPLHRPDADRYRRIVAASSREMARSGLVNLEGFLSGEGTTRLIAEIDTLMPRAHYSRKHENAYGARLSDDLPDDHPYRIVGRTERHGLAYHQIRDTALEALYRWPPLRQFVADVTGHGKLYLHEDPSNALVVQIYKAGGRLAWHFDRALFSTILNLQKSAGGGVFECVPGLRKTDDPCFDDVRDVLLDKSDRVEQHYPEAGSFSIMLGRYALHRVTAVEGATPRISVILSYEDRPGVRLDPSTRKNFFGPTAPND